MLLAYRLNPDKKLKKAIDSAIGFLLEQLARDSKGRLYLYDGKAEEVRLGDCALLVLALTEYMDVFENEQYSRECLALGEGTINQLGDRYLPPCSER